MTKQTGLQPTGLLLLGALLVGCGGVSGPGQPGGSFTLSGQVLPPGNRASSLSSEATNLDTLWAAPRVPGEVLLRGVPGGALGAQGLSALSGVRVQAVEGTGLLLAFTPGGENDAAFARRLADAGLRVQPNFRYEALAVPNDPGFPGDARPGVKVGSTFYDQDYLTRIEALGGWNRLDALGKPKSGALTAVLDTGVDRSHPELAGRLRQGFDFCARLVGDSCQGTDNVPDEVTAGDVGHGTSSAGLIAANTNNGVGIAALTWGGTVLPVKVFGSNGTDSSATSASVVAGLRYAAEQGARVVNMSLGFRGERGKAVQPDAALRDAIQDAADADIVLVAAAGNDPSYGLYYPAADPNVIAVGALGSNDSLACYSARPLSGQRALDLAAPGGQAGTGGPSCLVSSPQDILTLTTVTQGSYTLRAGTSEAAPMVSGAASLLRGAFPGLSADQIRQALRDGARKTGNLNILNVTGAVNQANGLDVQAKRGGQVVSTKTFSGTLSQQQQGAPYTLSGLPAGSYEVRATLKVNSQTYTGSVNVTVNGNTTRDIPAQR
jgi:subtilisin family serine protease